MDNIIFHIDVNNAFLSWSAVALLKTGYKYDIREIYAVIGGDESKRHGVVLAKSIPAKKLGIITGESLYSARKKYSKLEVFPPDFRIYEGMSNKLFELLSKYTPDIEVFSIDECSLDYTKVKNLYGDEIKFAYKLKDEIKNILGFTVNIGIGNNKLCAKMASDFEKPDKVHTLYKDEVRTKMWPLSVDNLFGIGRKTEQKLLSLNIKTIGDLANSSIDYLYPHFKNRTADIIDSANGIDNSPLVSASGEQKGVSNSTTLNHDLTTKEEVYQVLNELADNLGIQVRKQNKYAYVIAVSLKDNNFNTYSHQVKLVNPTNITREIFEITKKLFNQMWHSEPIRLVGVSLTNLVKEVPVQLSLFENITNREKDNKLEKVVDSLKVKYGDAVIRRASLVEAKNK